MKKVRFESSHPSCVSTRMEDSEECHSPRPFIRLQDEKIPPTLQESVCSTFLPRKPDVLEMYEGSNSYPYSAASKTTLGASALPRWKPSNELDLSMLDSSSQEPRKPVFMKAVTHNPIVQHVTFDSTVVPREERQVLNSIENSDTAPNVLTKDSSFFIRRDNLKMGQLPSLNNLGYQFSKVNVDKENNPMAAKAEIMKNGVQDLTDMPSQQAFKNNAYINPTSNFSSPQDVSCNCHHCRPKPISPQTNGCQKHFSHVSIPHTVQKVHNQCPCVVTYCVNCVSETHITRQPCQTNTAPSTTSPRPRNAVDQKTWAIEKYEQSKTGACTDVEKSSPVVKEKRKPCVSDLLKIIKLQNEQLQLLQQKVDKFIASNNNNNHHQPIPTQHVAEKVAVQALENNDHKISIGVMTSFEMFRTSTVINKEVRMQTHQNVQCNRSQISIKEVAFRQPGNLNFLDGISPVSKDVQDNFARNGQKVEEGLQCNIQQPDSVEKSMNEISLCDVQVDNTTTPPISPEPTMYLDVRDYSDSDSTSDDQSNVGWTYYNKVMTHVNGILQDSDMPSSASALYRDTRQRYVQMQIDKTNISVTKRVKFGDDPPVFYQPQPANPSSTDTSMKMHQLAAKYGIRSAPAHVQPAIVAPPADQSLATRNYMDRHRIMQGPPQPYAGNVRSPTLEMLRFLDITALKQQPKLL